MLKFNYPKICTSFLKELPPRTKEVVIRRFGLENPERETLEAIGKNWSITRERVRQIERAGLSQLQVATKQHQDVVNYIQTSLRASGKFRREDRLLGQLGGTGNQNHIYFLLTLGEPFFRYGPTDDFHPFWTIDKAAPELAREVISAFVRKFEDMKKPLPFKEVFELYKKEIMPKQARPLDSKTLLSCLEVSKRIGQGPTAQFGLSDWAEVKPRGIKDKAYLVIKTENKPLHFVKVASLIEAITSSSDSSRKTRVLPQTVHNELIKDPRFILVGRGIYALQEWGYEPGTVRDVISKVLQGSPRSLAKEQIVRNVLEQRLVKRNTILLNLQNKKYFSRDERGKYTLKSA